MSVIRSLEGVYNADGSVRGEIAYLIAELGGRAQCSLCEITHRGVRRRREFDEACGDVPVPFEFVHLADRSDEVRAASHGHAPCVLARTDTGLLIPLGSDELEACAGEPTALIDALRHAATERALSWPAPI